MSIEKVRTYLASFSLEDHIMEFSASSATVALAAQAVGCEEARIAKTLSFLIDDHPILIVTAGDMKIDNAKYKAQFHQKAKMLPPDQVEALVGHRVGGVCPFAVTPETVVYLDLSLQRFDRVYPAAGSANSAVSLTIPELELSSRYAAWVDVCKNV